MNDNWFLKICYALLGICFVSGIAFFVCLFAGDELAERTFESLRHGWLVVLVCIISNVMVFGVLFYFDRSLSDARKEIGELKHEMEKMRRSADDVYNRIYTIYKDGCVNGRTD